MRSVDKFTSPPNRLINPNLPKEMVPDGTVVTVRGLD